MNGLCYADDIVLLALSAKVLQKMLVTLQEGLTKLTKLNEHILCSESVVSKTM